MIFWELNYIKKTSVDTNLTKYGIIRFIFYPQKELDIMFFRDYYYNIWKN